MLPLSSVYDGGGCCAEGGRLTVGCVRQGVAIRGMCFCAFHSFGKFIAKLRLLRCSAKQILQFLHDKRLADAILLSHTLHFVGNYAVSVALMPDVANCLATSVKTTATIVFFTATIVRITATIVFAAAKSVLRGAARVGISSM